MKAEMLSTPSTEISDMQLAILTRPVGRAILIGQVDTLSPMLTPGGRDVRLWMRWVEPEETGVEGARIEFAMSTRRDEKSRTARVIARAAIVHRGMRSLYRLLEVQGLVDLWVCAPPAPDGSLHKVVTWLVCADLSQRSAMYGLATDPFPLHYV